MLRKSTTRHKEKYFVMIKGENHQTHITILSTYASKTEFQNTHSKTEKAKGKVEKLIIISKDFNIPLFPIVWKKRDNNSVGYRRIDQCY